MSNRTFLKALMAYVAGGHLLTGLFCILGRRGIERVGAPLYGAHFDPDAQFSHIVRPAGAFVAGLGVLQLPAVRDPERHKDIIDATLAVLFSGYCRGSFTGGRSLPSSTSAPRAIT